MKKTNEKRPEQRSFSPSTPRHADLKALLVGAFFHNAL